MGQIFEPIPPFCEQTGPDKKINFFVLKIVFLNKEEAERNAKEESMPSVRLKNKDAKCKDLILSCIWKQCHLRFNIFNNTILEYAQCSKTLILQALSLWCEEVNPFLTSRLLQINKKLVVLAL
ncbi:hypothetical protein ENBRE01_3276 [Enteropsectra breve]|nr:hypothetical protein ENBRE01_3276 [Enteropsectra breve]